MKQTNLIGCIMTVQLRISIAKKLQYLEGDYYGIL
jgi:hypothetical protein